MSHAIDALCLRLQTVAVNNDIDYLNWSAIGARPDATQFLASLPQGLVNDPLFVSTVINSAVRESNTDALGFFLNKHLDEILMTSLEYSNYQVAQWCKQEVAAAFPKNTVIRVLNRAMELHDTKFISILFT
jgi:hypothetical protein